MKINLERDIIPLFPTPIYTGIIDFPGESLLPHLEALEYHAIHRSISQTLYQDASTDIKLFEGEEFAALGEVILEAVHAFARDVYEIDCALRVTTSWATRAKQYAESRRHRHTNAYLSAVFYPHAEGPVGELRLERDPVSDFHVKPLQDNRFTTTSIVLPPASNLLVIFPSWLQHRVEPNPNATHRYSIASNYIPIGTYGEGDSTMTIS